MSYHLPENITIKARHGRDARLGLRARPLGGLGQADMDFTATEAARAEAGVRGAWPSTSTTTPPAGGTKTGGGTSVAPGGKSGAAPAPTTPLLPSTPATQSSTDWTPWLIGGGVALVALLGLGVAVSR